MGPGDPFAIKANQAPRQTRPQQQPRAERSVRTELTLAHFCGALLGALMAVVALVLGPYEAMIVLLGALVGLFGGHVLQLYQSGRIDLAGAWSALLKNR